MIQSDRIQVRTSDGGPRLHCHARGRELGRTRRGRDSPGGRNRRGRRADAEKPEPKKQGLFARLALFYRQIVAELRKVVWPTRNELITYTTVVIVFCLIIIGIVYSLDLGFARAALEIFG